MRAILIFWSAVALAQTTATSTQAVKPKTSTATSTTRKGPAKPAAKPAGPPPLTTDDQKTIYALGLTIYRSLGQFSLSPAELELVRRALADAAAGKPAEKLEEWGPKIQGLAKARASVAADHQKAIAQTYLDKAAAEPGAEKLPSGMVYRETRAGTGASPSAADTVKVNYRGTLVDGTEFDSSYSRNEPAQFPLGNVIKCWTEGVQKMKVGGKATLVCPSALAYGDNGRPPAIPGGATLVFDIELLEIPAAK